MSFGFSVGDFLATASLISSIVDALQKSSVSEFKELTLELHAVQRALNEIEHIQPSPGQEQSINAIKVVALLCQHPLQEFAGKLENGLLPKIDILIDIVNRLWTSNVQILNLVTRLQNTTSTPDVQHTYFQPPCYFEDALGRPLPVPSEYDMNVSNLALYTRCCSRTDHGQMLRAIISARFSSGPGHKKVHAGEYEIFNTSDNTQVLSECDLQSLIPGMKITMAFVIGRYQHRTLEECPRPGCKGRKFARKSMVAESVRPVVLRTERKWFKNVKICPSNIPGLPPCVDDQGLWIEAPTISESTHERRNQETLCKTSISPEKNANGHGYLIIRATVAAEIIRGIAEDLYLTVAELEDIAANDSEPGRLGIDSLMAVSISWRLKSLEIAPPKGFAAQDFYDGLFLESFIRDLVNKFGSCVSES
ncbi:MAG: hypothetical protein L6R42_004733 [Xanthoria sp. 1 TBL-2021]|nr:MAG: hypothetical protein L6R42_004733 [Xanthoria sp. 1 TBL-2021]